MQHWPTVASKAICTLATYRRNEYRSRQCIIYRFHKNYECRRHIYVNKQINNGQCVLHTNLEQECINAELEYSNSESPLLLETEQYKEMTLQLKFRKTQLRTQKENNMHQHYDEWQEEKEEEEEEEISKLPHVQMEQSMNTAQMSSNKSSSSSESSYSTLSSSETREKTNFTFLLHRLQNEATQWSRQSQRVLFTDLKYILQCEKDVEGDAKDAKIWHEREAPSTSSLNMPTSSHFSRKKCKDESCLVAKSYSLREAQEYAAMHFATGMHTSNAFDWYAIYNNNNNNNSNNNNNNNNNNNSNNVYTADILMNKTLLPPSSSSNTLFRQRQCDEVQERLIAIYQELCKCKLEIKLALSILHANTRNFIRADVIKKEYREYHKEHKRSCRAKLHEEVIPDQEEQELEWEEEQLQKMHHKSCCLECKEESHNNNDQYNVAMRNYEHLTQSELSSLVMWAVTRLRSVFLHIEILTSNKHDAVKNALQENHSFIQKSQEFHNDWHSDNVTHDHNNNNTYNVHEFHLHSIVHLKQMIDICTITSQLAQTLVKTVTVHALQIVNTLEPFIAQSDQCMSEDTKCNHEYKGKFIKKCEYADKESNTEKVSMYFSCVTATVASLIEHHYACCNYVLESCFDQVQTIKMCRIKRSQYIETFANSLRFSDNYLYWAIRSQSRNLHNAVPLVVKMVEHNKDIQTITLQMNSEHTVAKSHKRKHCEKETQIHTPTLYECNNDTNNNRELTVGEWVRRYGGQLITQNSHPYNRSSKLLSGNSNTVISSSSLDSGTYVHRVLALLVQEFVYSNNKLLFLRCHDSEDNNNNNNNNSNNNYYYTNHNTKDNSREDKIAKQITTEQPMMHALLHALRHDVNLPEKLFYMTPSLQNINNDSNNNDNNKTNAIINITTYDVAFACFDYICQRTQPDLATTLAIMQCCKETSNSKCALRIFTQHLLASAKLNYEILQYTLETLIAAHSTNEANKLLQALTHSLLHNKSSQRQHQALHLEQMSSSLLLHLILCCYRDLHVFDSVVNVFYDAVVRGIKPIQDTLTLVLEITEEELDTCRKRALPTSKSDTNIMTVGTKETAAMIITPGQKSKRSNNNNSDKTIDSNQMNERVMLVHDMASAWEDVFVYSGQSASYALCLYRQWSSQTSRENGMNLFAMLYNPEKQESEHQYATGKTSNAIHYPGEPSPELYKSSSAAQSYTAGSGSSSMKEYVIEYCDYHTNTITGASNEQSTVH